MALIQYPAPSNSGCQMQLKSELRAGSAKPVRPLGGQVEHWRPSPFYGGTVVPSTPFPGRITATQSRPIEAQQMGVNPDLLGSYR